ncbi:MAG: hypothetical protein R3B13_32500 [Polyangiaceae bacterium]
MRAPRSLDSKVAVTMLLALLACKRSGGRTSYWTSACVPQGSEAVLVTGGDESAELDLANGSVRQRKAEYRKAIGCRADGSVVESGIFSTVMGSTTAGVVALHWSDPNSELNWDRLVVDAPGTEPRSFELQASLFADIGSGHPAALTVKPAGLLHEDSAVVVAGYEPRTVAGRDATPTPFAFYSLDLSSGKASRWGAVFPSADIVHHHFARQYAIARDGSVALGVFGTENKLLAAGLTRDGSVGFRFPLDGAWEVQAAAVAQDGSRAAVGLTLSGGNSSHVDLIDMKSGALVKRWPASPTPGRVHFLHFLKNGDLVLITSARLAARLSPSGEVRWQQGS